MILDLDELMLAMVFGPAIILMLFGLAESEGWLP